MVWTNGTSDIEITLVLLVEIVAFYIWLSIIKL